jgi:hypothetical protein
MKYLLNELIVEALSNLKVCSMKIWKYQNKLFKKTYQIQYLKEQI